MKMKVLLLFHFASLVTHVFGSLGDSKDAFYIKCTNLCHQACGNRLADPVGVAISDLRKLVIGSKRGEDLNVVPLSTFEQLLFWDCEADCKYQCMHLAVQINLRLGYFIRAEWNKPPIQQYHGKWPFLRVLGMQELMSVVFSLLNAVPHVWFLLKARKSVPPYDNTYIFLWKGWAVIGLFAWSCSAIFHARDTLVTERLDYHSALAFIMYGFFVNALELYKILIDGNMDERHHNKIRLVSFVLVALFWGMHVSYLNFVKFDYGWNMAVGVFFQLAGFICWLIQYGSVVFQLEVWKEERNKHILIGLAANLLLIAAALFELSFDFPPFLMLLDAHALWHMVTPYTAYLWYIFILRENLVRDGIKLL